MEIQLTREKIAPIFTSCRSLENHESFIFWRFTLTLSYSNGFVFCNLNNNRNELNVECFLYSKF